MQVALHEALLASPHRTLDPESADFFFLPVYGTPPPQPLHFPPATSPSPEPTTTVHAPGGCAISRFFRPTPAHNLFTTEQQPWIPAPVLGSRLYRRALEWIQRRFPYWARRGGADHLVAFPHDEGACIAPVEMANATLLTSWGRSQLHPPNASTSMPEHSWWHPLFLPSMYASQRWCAARLTLGSPLL